MDEIYRAYVRIRLVWAIAWRWVAFAAFVAVIWWLGGCTLTKPGMTAESKAQDKYECEKEAYAASGGHANLVTEDMYRQCMHQRGYN